MRAIVSACASLYICLLGFDFHMASNTGNLGGVPPDEVVAGSVISVKTVLGDEYKGGVFAFDASAGILIIRKYTTCLPLLLPFQR